MLHPRNRWSFRACWSVVQAKPRLIIEYRMFANMWWRQQLSGVSLGHQSGCDIQLPLNVLGTHGQTHSVLSSVSISEKTSYRKISWSIEAARFVFRIIRSLLNLTGTSAAKLLMCLSNFKAIRQFKVPISWLRDFTRSYDKTSFRILRWCPACLISSTPVLASERTLFHLVKHRRTWSSVDVIVLNRYLLSPWVRLLLSGTLRRTIEMVP